MKKALYGFTDYPFVELGDEPGKLATIRAAKAISYDQDKYLKIEVKGIITEIKAGYFYKKPGNCGGVPTFSYSELCQLPKTKY